MAFAIPEKFGIMAVDQGGTTAVAVGLFTARATVAATLKRAVRKDAIRVKQAKLDPVVTAHVLAHTWRDFAFVATVEAGIPPSNVWLIMEDFHLRKGTHANLAPVQILYATRTLQRQPLGGGYAPGEYSGFARKIQEGVQWHDDVYEGCFKKQEPSDAMNYATNARLRDWGLYPLTVGGGDHKRDAVRHMCLGVNRVLDGKY